MHHSHCRYSHRHLVDRRPSSTARRIVEELTAVPTATVSVVSATSSTAVLSQQFCDVSVDNDMLSVFQPLTIEIGTGGA